MDDYLLQPLHFESRAPYAFPESLKSFLLAHEPPTLFVVRVIIFLLLAFPALVLSLTLKHIRITHHTKEVQHRPINHDTHGVQLESCVQLSIEDALRLFLEYLEFEDGQKYGRKWQYRGYLSFLAQWGI